MKTTINSHDHCTYEKKGTKKRKIYIRGKKKLRKANTIKEQ